MRRTILILKGPRPSDNGGNAAPGNAFVTLQEIENACESRCREAGVGLSLREADDAGQMCRWLAAENASFDGVIVSPEGAGADILASDACRSALQKLSEAGKPVIEVHAANIFSGSAAKLQPLHPPGDKLGFVAGFGVAGYILAVDAMIRRFGDAK